ncbi:hypothetical protein [Echinicola shivajiensis]|uniref:hypothetical protein n=1 Tax=Echinicola shivajiensis TaxID=1035916 RepID=UPI001BFCCF62|nr:hypothetical protein [Echinicola shivajiensis]
MLNKLCLILILAIWCCLAAKAQIIKEFNVEEQEGLDLVQLDFSSYKGVSQIKRMYSSDPILIHTHLSKVNILPEFNYEINDRVLHASLSHHNVENEGFGKGISSKLFANSEGDFDHTWEVGLSEKYTYDMNFHFGIGKANLDLSGLNVKKCKVKTATADVDLNYVKNASNGIEMDTLMVKVNMGTVKGVNIACAKADQMIFDVNYGRVDLNFEDDFETLKPCNISATVGAGSVHIVLPSNQYPYIVKIKSTAMCRTSVPGHLSVLDKSTYASKAYDKDADNIMTFEIDVSVGSLTLK